MKKVASIKELKQQAGKKSYSGFLNPMCDFLSFYPAKLFLYLPFNPVQITVIWILIKVVMAALLIEGGYWLTVSALLIFQLASILDGVDGIVARYRKDYSYNGIYLDYIGHYLCNSVLLIGLAIGDYNHTGSVSVFYAATIGVFSYLFSKSITVNPSMWVGKPEQRLEMEQMVYSKNLALKRQKPGFWAMVYDFFLMDNPFNFMFWGVVFGFTEITLWIYGIALFLEALRRVAVQYLRINKAERSKKSNR
ncbi:MAG TPA: CDP-alcohol phosphatidyltransferase family protein [Candidatus Nanoarchaeia archaeon]|nr:CDP-alcohol phosphatidyltransferase family protein [Candidatus Nanoarchaeia archaeon]